MSTRSGGRIEKNTPIIISITGSAIGRSVIGVPTSIMAGDNRGKDQFGNEVFSFTGLGLYVPPTGSTPPASASIGQWPSLAADLATVTGLGSAKNIYPITELTVETISDTVGSAHMVVESSTGIANVTASNTASFPSKRALTFTVNAAGRFSSSLSPAHDPTTSSFCFLEVRRLSSADAQRYTTDHRGSTGYTISQLASQILRVTLTDADLTNQNLAGGTLGLVPGNDYVFLWGVDRSTNEVFNIAHDGNVALHDARATLTATGSLSPDAGLNLRWGRPNSGTSVESELIYQAYFEGGAAEGAGSSNAALFAAHIGLSGSVLPTTAAGLAAVTTNLAEPKHIWPINELSSSLFDSVADATLTAGSTPQYVSAATGSITSGVERAVHLDETSADRFTAPSSTYISPGTGSYGFLMVINLDNNTAARQFLRKFDGTVTGQSLLCESSERLDWRVGDGTTLIQLNSINTLTAGNWYVVAFGVDRTATGTEVALYTHNGTTGTSETASIGAATGSHTYSGASMTLGFTSNSVGANIAYMAYYEGAAWEGVAVQDCADIASLLGL